MRDGIPRAYLARLDAQSPVNGAATISVAALVAGLLLSQQYSIWVVLWAATQISLAALVLVRWWRRAPLPRPALEARPTRRGLYQALGWAVLSGCLWGALTAFLPGAPAHVQIVLILSMGGMAAGASATLAAVPQVAAAYIVTCTLPATVYYLVADEPAGGALALVFGVFMLAMIAMSQVVFSALLRQFGAESYARELEQVSSALRESEQRFRATFENAAVGIAHVGMDGAWLRLNDRVCEILGYRRDELLSRTFQDVTHPDDLSANLALFEDLVNGASTGYQMEKRYLRKDGTPVWAHLTTALQCDDAGRPLYSISVIQDITARKAAEQALRESDRAKNEFLAVLGHELRNPLAPLRTGVEILKSSPHDQALLDSLLPVLDRQLSHMVRLVDDLLDIGRINRGVIELQQHTLDVNEPLGAAIEQTRSLIEERRHTLVSAQADGPVIVDGDRERLTQVFANLLDNAAKYMAPGGNIQVTSAVEAGSAVVRVRDGGYGIPPGRIEDVFELFNRIPEHSGVGGGGLGIGLALCRRLVELHGGVIGAASEGAGQGAEFVVRLPLSECALETPAEVAADPADKPARSVLIVDDNVDAADSLYLLLKVNGVAADVAYDGPNALDLIEAKRPEVVLLDLGLPGMDGFEIARRARAMCGDREMLLVAVTGWGQDEDRSRTAAAGFDVHLTKPLSWEELAPHTLPPAAQEEVPEAAS